MAICVVMTKSAALGTKESKTVVLFLTQALHLDWSIISIICIIHSIVKNMYL